MQEKIKYYLIAGALLLCFIGGLGTGYVLGTQYTIKALVGGFDYIDNINIDINETKMVEAMIPYVNQSSS